MPSASDKINDAFHEAVSSAAVMGQHVEKNDAGTDAPGSGTDSRDLAINQKAQDEVRAVGEVRRIVTGADYTD